MTENTVVPPGGPSYVVGVGASAGGLESLELFFGALPSTTGMAVVVIQHLAPDHKSLMSELLRKHTAMSVEPATHGTFVEPNCVYLIPPGNNVEIREGHLVLTERMDHPHRRPNYAVDQFFRSLALDCAERAIGVVLSGTGSDGAHGSLAIKAAGGIVLAEKPETAKFGSMPRSAIDIGAASGVCPVSELPAEIMRHVGLLDAEVVPSKEGFEKILSLVSEHAGIEFEAYKPTTVARRVERRRASTDCSSLESYAELLEKSPEECMILGRELLVGVTAFFRDSEVFAALPERLENLLEEASKRRDRVFRAWVVACSTGEEAYSLAIVCHEIIRLRGLDVELKLFATDVNDESLASAGRGRYPFSVRAEVPPEILSRYFESEVDAYQARPFLRKSVVFARHDVLRDPPFTRIDVLSCRNMLIYFAADAQRRTKNVFQFALRQGGLLVLGSSETLGPEDQHFQVLDEHCRFYEMGSVRAAAHSVAVDLQRVERLMTSSGTGPARIRPTHSATDPTLRLLEGTLEWLAQPALIINSQGGLAYAFGRSATLLRIPTGRAIWNAAELLPEKLGVVVSSLVERAITSGEEILVRDVVFETASTEHKTDIRAVPLGSAVNPDRGVVLFFEDLGRRPARLAEGDSSQSTTEYTVDDAVQNRIHQLEEELNRTRAKLSTTVEELEASNEELQATNEELVSSNEELQSTNEELQSLNEELHTVNAELQSKVEELSILSADLGNLLRTMGAGLLFLDMSGRVRRYNDHVLDVVPLVPHDVGRPLRDIAHRLEGVDLGYEVRRVIDTGVGMERQVRASSGQVYGLVMQPFETQGSEAEGVVVTFNDVTKLEEVNERLQVYSRIIDQSPSMSVIADANGSIDYANPAYSSATGLRPLDLRGVDIRATLADRMEAEDGVAFRAALDGGHAWSGNAWLKTASSTPLGVRASVFPVRNAEGVITHFVELAEVSERPAAPA